MMDFKQKVVLGLVEITLFPVTGVKAQIWEPETLALLHVIHTTSREAGKSLHVSLWENQLMTEAKFCLHAHGNALA